MAGVRGLVSIALAASAAAGLVSCGEDEPKQATVRIHDGDVSVGDRTLYLECEGTGTPVVVYETIIIGGRDAFQEVQDRLVDTTTVCTYDRANLGLSDRAPRPRTGRDVVDDAHAMLEAAGVPAPYILVGSSAGADHAIHHARAYPDDVAGVVAWNPVLLDPSWSARLDEHAPPADVEYAQSFRAGEVDSPEGVNWFTSAEQAVALPAPRDVPLVLLQSEEIQCAAVPEGCPGMYPVYLELGEEYAATWPGATHRTVSLGHELDREDPDLVAGLVEELIAASRKES